MEIRWKLDCEVVATHVPTCEAEENEELKNLLKWGKWKIAKFSHT